MKSLRCIFIMIGLVLVPAITTLSQNINYSAYCIATKMKHDCDYFANEEGRFSVQVSDNLNWLTWYRAGDGSGNMNKCLICDGDANTSSGHTCNWNIQMVSKNNVSVSKLRLSFRATDDDAGTVVNNWWMDDDCTYTLDSQAVVLSTLTPGINNDITVGHSTDPQWYATYRIFWEWVTVSVPSIPLAHANPSCGPTYLEAAASSQSLVTWYWQGTNPNGTSTAYPSTTNYLIDTTGIYYLRAKGNLNNVWSATSSSVYAVIKTMSSPATGINVTNNNTPQGTVKTLSVTGGSLGTGATWKWYDEAACITLIGTGNFIDVDPPATRAYWVRAEGDCDTTFTASTTVVVGSSGVETIDESGMNLNIYPNPAHDMITISALHVDEPFILRIQSIHGKMIAAYHLSEMISEISLHSLPAGIYVLEFSSEKHHTIKKLIIE